MDRFFQAAGVLLLEGYGLTETTPVVSVRLQDHPVPGTIGPLLDELQMKLLDPETGEEVGPGKKGVIHLKGPNVMKGYYKRPDKTAEVLSADGWLNTGDLGMVTYKGEIRIIGRTKETIVLLGGENVEPVPIEDTILEKRVHRPGHGGGPGPEVPRRARGAQRGGAGEVRRGAGDRFRIHKEDLLDNPQIIELISDEINSRG